MYTTIESFETSNEKYSLYHINCESNNILAKLFGSYLTWNTINKYADICFDLDIGLTYSNDNIHFHIWIDGELIDSSIEIKNYGSDIIYMLEEIVGYDLCILKEKS